MSLRKAINDMCSACIYDPEAEGTWRQQVGDCTSKGCPLYPYRPQPKKTASRPEKEPK